MTIKAKGRADYLHRGKMKRNKEEKLEKKHRYDKGQIFVKVMAGFLALLMVIGTVFTIVAALI